MTDMELQTTLDPIEMDMGDPEIIYSPVLPNPEGEPTDDLTKVTIQGNIYKIKDSEVHDWARAEEKPTYTKAEVGLGNVDNTSDLNKPISTATQTALDNKVDKVAGKGLSTNDFTNDFKTKLEGIEAGAEVNTVNSVAGKTGNVTLNKSDVGLGNVDNTSDMNKPVSTATQTALNGKVDNSTLNNYYTKTETDTALGNKVDKVQGKGLSTNDYDDTAKGIVDGVTSALADKVDKVEGYGLSENDYSDEEKALVGTITDKLDKTENAIRSNALAIISPVTDTAPYIYRQTPVKESFKALMHKIVGASVVWNQMCDHLNSYTSTIFTNNGDGSFTANGTVGSTQTLYKANGSAIPLYANHKYFVKGSPKNGGLDSYGIDVRKSNGGSIYANIDWDIGNGFVFNITENLEANIQMRLGANYTAENVVFKPQLFDLTAMFGTTIADYVYTLEQATAGSGIAWLQSYGYFTEDYYAYTQNTIESVSTSGRKVVRFNQWDEVWENGMYNTTTGEKRNDGSSIRSVNAIPLLPNVTYYVSTPQNLKPLYYTENGTYIGTESSLKNSTLTIPQNARLLRFFMDNSYGRPYNNDICINISDTAKNGTYEPYTETTYPISPITLRGLFKLSTDKLTVDGDEYNADGSVKRRYGIVDLGAEDMSWSYNSDNAVFASSFTNRNRKEYPDDNTTIPNFICDKYITTSNAKNNAQAGLRADKSIFARSGNYQSIYVKDTSYTDATAFKTAMSGVYLIYELETPTTEQTTPFTETEIVGSTEEFIDYEVAQGNRDVAIPVGTDTDYYQEMKLPPLPTTSGNHNLIYNPSTGFGWS